MDLYKVFLDNKEIFNTTDKKAVLQAMNVLSNMYEIEYQVEGNNYVLFRKNCPEV